MTGPHLTPEECQHANVRRVARLYFSGRPLYACDDCDARFTYEDDEPSHKGLAPLRGEWNPPDNLDELGHPAWDPDPLPGAEGGV